MREKRHDRQPHRDNLSDRRSGNHRQHRSDRDHPIAQDSFYKCGGPSTAAQRHISQRLSLCCLLQQIAQRPACGGPAIRYRQVEKSRIEDTSQHVPEVHPAPISEQFAQGHFPGRECRRQ